ncbi:MAG: alpha/beta fold hydrolase [Candidatus Nanopelagicales bacterium]
MGSAPAVAPTGESTAPAALRWRPCESRALRGYDCARLKVPRDWQQPALGTITLAMVRHRSTGATSERIGSLFMNPGGPGGTGLDTITAAWGFLPEAVQERFDLVSWDPRGLGASTALVGCRSVTWSPPPATGPVDWSAIQARVRAQVADANADCVAKNPQLAPYIGTRQVVRDLDAMRSAVGDTRLNYWAWSYGTRIAYTYALTFPGKLRALVLDGSISPHGSLAGFAAQFDTAADTALGLLFQTYPQSATHYRRVLRGLHQAPLRLNAQRTFTRWDLGRFLEEYAQWESLYEPVAGYLKDLDTALYGSPAERRRAKARLLRAAPLPYDAMTGAPAIIQCLDYADRQTAAQLDAAAAQARIAAPITGWYRSVGVAAPCEGLNLTPDPVPTTVPANWTARLLLLGATLDAQTAYVWTTQMGTLFRASRVVTYVGAKHVTFGAAGSACVDRHATRYLLTLRLPSVNVSCPHVPSRP